MGLLIVEENHLTEDGAPSNAAGEIQVDQTSCRHQCMVIRSFDRKAKRSHVLEGAATSILAQFNAFKDAVAVRSFRFPVTAPL